MIRRALLNSFARAALVVSLPVASLAASVPATPEPGSGLQSRGQPCSNPHGKLKTTLRLAGTQADLRALLVDVRYPEEKLSLPGTANEPSVAARIKATNGSATVTPNDDDGELKMELIDPFAALGNPPAEIEFDRCIEVPVSA